MKKMQYCPRCDYKFYIEESLDVLTVGSVIEFMKNNIKSFSDEEKLEIKNLLNDSIEDEDTFIFTDKNEVVNNKKLKNEDGNFITKRGYYDIQKFINGYAIVVIACNVYNANPDYWYGVIDKEGNEVIEPGSEGTYDLKGLHYVLTEIEELRKQAGTIPKRMVDKKTHK